MDIAGDRNDLALGSGWFPLEHYLKTSFRWVSNDAIVRVAALRPGRYVMRCVVEPGPGLDLAPFVLEFRRPDGSTIDRANVRGKQPVTLVLPIDTPELLEIVLHVDGGGRPLGSDPRVLNFRVFSIDVERGEPDVLPFAFNLGRGWHALEAYDGRTFRWVENDAEIWLANSYQRPIVMDVEAGPSLASKRFRLDVVADDGTSVASADIDGRGVLSVDLSASPSRAFRLHVDGGGLHTAGDPRVMNFRVFRPST